MDIIAEIGERHIPNIETILKKLDFLDKKLNYDKETSLIIAELAYYIRRENIVKQELVNDLLNQHNIL